MEATRDRADDIVRGRSSGWIGYFDHGPWSSTLERWVKEGYPTRRDGRGSEVPVEHFDHFEYDMWLVGGWFDIMPISNHREVVAEDDVSVTIRNGAGAVIRNWKHAVSTPEYVGFSMTDRRCWEEVYKPRLLVDEEKRLDIDTAKRQLKRAREAGRWAFYGHQFIWENMRASLGNVCMLESLLLDPGWIHDFCQTYTDLYRRLFAKLVEQAGRPDGIWIYEDLGYCKDLACSPLILETMIFPYYRQIIEFFTSMDLPVILHSDGRIDKAIPLIIDAGFAGINPIEVKAGCDLFSYVKRFGRRLAFVGGFDCRILETGDRVAIKAEVRRLAASMRERGARFMLGVDHSVPDTVSYDTFRCFRDEVRAVSEP